MVNPARSEPALRDLETAALAKQNIGHGHAHIAEGDLAVSMRSIVIAEYVELAKDGDAGGIHREPGSWTADDVVPPRIGLTHEDGDAGTASPPRRWSTIYGR